jgi:hypothetical protein
VVFRTFILALIAFGSSAFATPAHAQILNTLRGFDEKEMGWSGGIEGAIATASGNTEYFEFEVGGAIQHQGEKNRWRFLGRTMQRTASGNEIARSQIGHIRHNYRLAPRFSTLAFLQGQYEPFRRIQKRYLAGAGAQTDLHRSVDWNSVLGASIMYENEELTDNNGITTSDARLSFFLSVFRDVKEGVDVDFVGFYQPLVDNLGDARASVTFGMRADIVGELYTFVRYVAEYDSEPAPGVDDLDQNLRAGLGYKF